MELLKALIECTEQQHPARAPKGKREQASERREREQAHMNMNAVHICMQHLVTGQDPAHEFALNLFLS